MKLVGRTAIAAGLIAFAATAASASPDPVKVDPKHYKVMFENAQVRVLHIHYGPHETSVMHWHPNSVVTYLTDGHIKFQLPNGKTVDGSGTAGDAKWGTAGAHKPTNVGDKAFDAVLVELKGSPGKK
jgi:hypothetical protein